CLRARRPAARTRPRRARRQSGACSSVASAASAAEAASAARGFFAEIDVFVDGDVQIVWLHVRAGVQIALPWLHVGGEIGAADGERRCNQRNRDGAPTAAE